MREVENSWQSLDLSGGVRLTANDLPAQDNSDVAILASVGNSSSAFPGSSLFQDIQTSLFLISTSIEIRIPNPIQKSRSPRGARNSPIVADDPNKPGQKIYTWKDSSRLIQR
jgi:hypothetical protein